MKIRSVYRIVAMCSAKWNVTEYVVCLIQLDCNGVHDHGFPYDDT
jgi:hypothetical protein